jgi:hypothetical protein
MKSGVKANAFQASQRSKGVLAVHAHNWSAFRGPRFFSHELTDTSGAACLFAALTASNVAPVKSRSCVAVRAQAAAEESGAVELSRRQLISSSIALSAAASLSPLAATQPAFAANKVLSSDWEKVSGHC